MSRLQEAAFRRRTVATMLLDEYRHARSKTETHHGMAVSFFDGWADAMRRALVLMKELETGERRLGKVHVPR